MATTTAAGVLLVLCGALAGADPSRPHPAVVMGTDAMQPFDAAPFGRPLREPDGKAVGVQWAEPRKIRRLVVEFAPETPCPPPRTAQVQYWHGHWDGRADPPAAELGAGGIGWAAMDDWTNGRWKQADARLERLADGRRWCFRFTPTGTKEFKDLGQAGVIYRKTLKIRLLAAEPLPEPSRLQAFTDATYRALTVRILWGRPARDDIPLPEQAGQTGRLEAYNGLIRAIRPAPGASLTVLDDQKFRYADPLEGGIEADLLFAVDPLDERYDRTIITVRLPGRAFSFAADEVARGRRILVDDLGVLVVRGDDTATLDQVRREQREHGRKTIYHRVFERPEQTLARAWADMPGKCPLYFVHGLPGNRNAMLQEPNGDVVITARKRWFNLPRSPKDSDRKLWTGERLVLRFGLPAEHLRGGRELRDGYLPMLRTWWQAGPIYYEQTTILDKLEPDLSDIRLDDPTVLRMRLRVVNVSDRQTAAARLRLHCEHGAGETLRIMGKRAFGQADDGEPRFRYLFDTAGRGRIEQDGPATCWSLELGPGESHNLILAIPSITLTEEHEMAALEARDFDADAERLCAFWHELTGRATRIETPEPWLNDFYKAHLRHMLINCWREPGSDRLHAHVGTFDYGVYPDESCMMISDLDRRGYTGHAERCLQSFLDYQGTAPLPGNFQSTEGLFYGSGGHETGGYNKSHGWVMWCMAEHWWLTRDRQWMQRAAPKLLQACRWVIWERRATMKLNPDGTRPLEYGFLPAGALEDVTDYWYWLVTNACTVWGFQALAHALADYGHPQAPRLLDEAKAYRDDVLRGLTESRIRAPVVRLRDGTYVPKYPSRLYERGRCHGWLRETLEGSIHLLITGLLDPCSPEAEWILKDFEDNLYISERYGYAIPAFDRFWFSRGGFSMQANLLGGPLAYLYRDEIRHYLRAYFNAFASAFYPEVRMCNEHSLPELGYPAGDHFKSSDEAQSTYWLRLMFVHERDGRLYLGQAIPRYWLRDGRTVAIERACTHFGELSLRIRSHAGSGRIEAVLDPPSRNSPERILLRLRHPDASPMQAVTVNGKAHERFDATREWIVLPGTCRGRQHIVALYG